MSRSVSWLPPGRAPFSSHGERASRANGSAIGKKRLGTVSAPPSFVAVRLPSSSRGRETIEIRVDGVAVHVREDLDVAHVARLVAALGKRPGGC